MDENKSNNNIKIIVTFFLSMLLILTISIIDFFSFSDAIVNEMFSIIIPRLLGGIVFLMLMYMIGYKKLYTLNGPFFNSLKVILPGLIIAINNFPIISYFDARADITQPTYTVFIFLLECLSIGFFEEIVFRGIVLILLLQRFPSSKKGMYLAVFTSSAIFALSHLINLFGGALFSNTLEQVGYSFLMGLLWAIVYLKTKNIWMSVLLHSSYNFFGLVLFRLGYVNNRFDTVTLVVTVILSLLVAIYTLYVSFKIDEKELQEFYTIWY